MRSDIYSLLKNFLNVRNLVSACMLRMVLPYSSASSWSLQGFSTLQATWVGGLMSVHSFSSTVLVSPDELILMHSTVRGWTPGPQEVEHYAQAWHKIQIEVLKSVLVLDFSVLLVRNYIRNIRTWLHKPVATREKQSARGNVIGSNRSKTHKK